MLKFWVKIHKNTEKNLRILINKVWILRKKVCILVLKPEFKDSNQNSEIYVLIYLCVMTSVQSIIKLNHKHVNNNMAAG